MGIEYMGFTLILCTESHPTNKILFYSLVPEIQLMGLNEEFIRKTFLRTQGLE